LVAGGEFDAACINPDCSTPGQALGSIGRWDPTAGAWLPLGSGTNQSVLALAAAGGRLWAGGDFSVAGGRVANHFAQFGELADAGAGATVAPDPPVFLTTVVYTATVTNNGPGAATGVTLTVGLSPGLNVQTSATSAGSCAGTGPITCTLGTIPVGGAVTVTVQAQAAVLGQATATVSVGSTTVDPIAGNDGAVVQRLVITATPTLPPGAPTFTPTPTATLPPGVPTFTPSPTATLAPGQTLPSFGGLTFMNAPLD
jgi:uncharacterized repeat protein (TIGR01451 family)